MIIGRLWETKNERAVERDAGVVFVQGGVIIHISEIPRAFAAVPSLPRAPVSDRGKLDSGLVAYVA